MKQRIHTEIHENKDNDRHNEINKERNTDIENKGKYTMTNNKGGRNAKQKETHTK